MSLAQKSARSTGGHTIKIKGKVINVHLARIVYKCAVCGGDLKKQDFGLKCIANPEHRGFIHRKELEALELKQEKNIKKLERFYTVEKGIVKCL